jgi:hypothetical protein
MNSGYQYHSHQSARRVCMYSDKSLHTENFFLVYLAIFGSKREELRRKRTVEQHPLRIQQEVSSLVT